MSENLMRHFIALMGSLVCIVVYWAGYVGGRNGMWWTVFGIIIIYVIVYKLIEV